MAPIDTIVDATIRHEIFVSTIGRNPTRPARSTDAFFEEVYRLCVRCLDGQPTAPAFVAFVLSERPDVDEVLNEHSERFEFVGRLDDRCQEVAFQSIVIACANLRLAFAVVDPATDVPMVVDRLKTLGLGARPAAIFIPSTRTLTFYHRGVDQGPSTSAETKPLKGLDPGNFDAVLDYFHEHWTKFPSGNAPCWDNATNRVVERNAERNVRNALNVFLGMIVFRTKFVVRELDRTNGRIDIYIFSDAFNAATAEDVILELKVLRSRSIGWTPGVKGRTYSDGGNLRYVQRGLRQAKRYVASSEANSAFLLCFDARLNNSDIAVHDYAAELSVQYRRYYMESSVTEA